MADIKFVFGLPPKKAIEWLKTKHVTAENYRNLTESELAKVYTIARMTDLDMLNDIKQGMVRAAENGMPFHAWQKSLLQHMADKGWLHPNGHNGTEIIDPKTGEVFGAPRRLENIYRTNMQAAYQAGLYQTLMQNADNRPYWQYDAVNDHRTRPAHSAMDGLVYRYDDPFWATFYPPNGYRCRCSVIALSDRDMERQGLILSQSGEHNLVSIDKPYNKKGGTYRTTAYKAPDGTLHTTDKGFAYNPGRMNYRPDLDQYDRALAQQFAKAEMQGAEFQTALKQLHDEFYQVKTRMGINGKPDKDTKTAIRNTLSRQLKFAAGVLTPETQKLTGMKRATVWLSDDTLVKQIDSREGQNFGAGYYAFLPDFLQNPEHIARDGRELVFTTRRNGEYLWAVLKYVENADELYLQSYRISNEREIAKMLAKKEVLK